MCSMPSLLRAPLARLVRCRIEAKAHYLLSRDVAQNPNAPSPVASVGEVRPRLSRPRRTFRQLCLGTFPNAVFDSQKVLFAKGVNTDYNQNTKPVITASQPAIDADCPDIDPFIAAQISFGPIIVLRCPLALEPRKSIGSEPGGVRAKQYLQRGLDGLRLAWSSGMTFRPETESSHVDSKMKPQQEYEYYRNFRSSVQPL